jgi:DMSO/TMAO reductase YedYZ molybdopterin-dependent catalytic subunit
MPALSGPHSAPVRVVVRMNGYKNVKWMSRIEVEPRLDTVGLLGAARLRRDAWVGASN